ncbi:MAG: HD domain-containing protein [Dehalococcoidia bacterium]|nr:HD domain-containing protein [Dehalococcoidia bacterium]
MWRSPRYRAAQFVRGLRPALQPDEARLVRRLLSDSEFQLFAAMDPRDRRHSMDMVLWLRSRPPCSDDLLAAALLHDVGKGRLRDWERIAFVLLGAVRWRARERFVRAEGRGLRGALWRLEHHARLGAALLGAAGTRPAVVELVGRHSDPGLAEGDLARLRAADAAC